MEEQKITNKQTRTRANRYSNNR